MSRCFLWEETGKVGNVETNRGVYEADVAENKDLSTIIDSAMLLIGTVVGIFAVMIAPIYQLSSAI